MMKILYICIFDYCLMEKLVEISKAQVIMTFVATCVETTARFLKTSYKEAYELMSL